MNQEMPKENSIESVEKERVFRVVEDLEETEDNEKAKELLEKFFDIIVDDLEIELTDDVESIYREAERSNDLFRLEQLSRVMHSLVDHDPIKVGDEEDRYANAVTPDGIDIAFAEGEAPGPVRFLIGFDFKSAIGFDSEGLEVKDIESQDYDLRNSRLRSALCRHVHGKISSDSIDFMVFRTPKDLFPEGRMTEEEKSSPQKFIFRGAKIENTE